MDCHDKTLSLWRKKENRTMAKKNIDLSVVLHDDSDYKDWLVELKERFYSHRLKASCATNGYLLDFYWKLGRDIEAKQYTTSVS